MCKKDDSEKRFADSKDEIEIYTSLRSISSRKPGDLNQVLRGKPCIGFHNAPDVARRFIDNFDEIKHDPEAVRTALGESEFLNLYLDALIESLELDTIDEYLDVSGGVGADDIRDDLVIPVKTQPGLSNFKIGEEVNFHSLSNKGRTLVGECCQAMKDLVPDGHVCLSPPVDRLAMKFPDLTQFAQALQEKGLSVDILQYDTERSTELPDGVKELLDKIKSASQSDQAVRVIDPLLRPEHQFTIIPKQDVLDRYDEVVKDKLMRVDDSVNRDIERNLSELEFMGGNVVHEEEPARLNFKVVKNRFENTKFHMNGKIVSELADTTRHKASLGLFGEVVGPKITFGESDDGNHIHQLMSQWMDMINHKKPKPEVCGHCEYFELIDFMPSQVECHMMGACCYQHPEPQVIPLVTYGTPACDQEYAEVADDYGWIDMEEYAVHPFGAELTAVLRQIHYNDPGCCTTVDHSQNPPTILVEQSPIGKRKLPELRIRPDKYTDNRDYTNIWISPEDKSSETALSADAEEKLRQFREKVEAGGFCCDEKFILAVAGDGAVVFRSSIPDELEPYED